jgi:DNA-binding beta-propeller fold protein YncE
MESRRCRKASGVAVLMLTTAAMVWMSGGTAAGNPQTSALAPATAPSANTMGGEPTATGKLITPTAAKGAIFQELNPRLEVAPERRAGYAAAVSVSPNGKRLAIMTSGFPAWFDQEGKILPEASVEFVFLFDVTGHAPRQLQVLSVPNTFPGLAWGPASDRIFVSGGKDDTVVEFVDNVGTFLPGRPIRLGHRSGLGCDKSDLWCGPVTGGLAVSPDGTRLLVANLQNDSVSLIDLAGGKIIVEQDLRPGNIDRKHRDEPGGGFTRAVTWISSDRAYVASTRGREIVSLGISHDKIRVTGRLAIKGQPAALLANRSGSRLYAAIDTTSHVEVFDTAGNTLIERIDTVAPPSIYDNSKMLGGANSNALALTPDERTLLVSNGGQNSVAVVRLSELALGAAPKAIAAREDRDGDEKNGRNHSETVGLVPTGWYPTGVATSKNGATWYVVNAKSPMGPNIGWCKETGHDYCDPKVDQRTLPWLRLFPAERYLPAENGVGTLLEKNAHVRQLDKAGFLTISVPDGLELARLTKQVARNNHFDQLARTEADERLFAFLRQHIKHVIYILKENRTYDQVLGDLEVGNGDPRFTLFPEKIAPNHHALARNFVTLDNLLLCGEGSVTGHSWTWLAQTTDMLEHNDALGDAIWYKGERGGVVFDVTADGPGGEAGKGSIWDAALRGGLSIRDYFGASLPNGQPPIRDLRAAGRKGTVSGLHALWGRSDPYYPDSDWYIGLVPDFWRVREWKYEFAEFVANGSLPNLMTVYVPNDHLGNFGKAYDGVNTPETQMADNDYAVGTLIETVANSPYAKDTVVITIEDDPSDGPDHVDAQRSVVLFAGPFVRQHAVVSTRYTTVSVVKTIEEILGIGPIGLNDALAAPMSDVFDPNQAAWTYKAIVPDVLYSTKLPLPPADHASKTVPKHSAAYWTKAMAGQDFSGPDRIDPVTFNRALWRGLKGDAPYPDKTK